jgi:hypothetical protein
LIFPTEPAATGIGALEAPVEQPVGEEAIPEAEFAQKAASGTPEAPVLESARSAADELPPTEEAMMLSQPDTAIPAEGEVETLEVQQIPTEAVAELVETQEAGIDAAEPAVALEPVPSQPRLWAQFALWVIELLFLLIALGSGVIVIYLKVKNRP